MGMFDYITCKYPLPGTAPSWLRDDYRFQTKDTPLQYLEDYEITSDGLLVGPNADGFSGDIEFGSSNATGGWGEVVYSEHGEDVESATYVATFVSAQINTSDDSKRFTSRLTQIRQIEYRRGPAIKAVPPSLPSKEEVEAFNRKYSGPMVGRTLYMLMGLQEVGTSLEVLAENDRHFSCRVAVGDGRYHRSGDLLTVHRSFGSTLFLSEDDAFACRRARMAAHQAEIDRFRAHAEKWVHP